MNDLMALQDVAEQLEVTPLHVLRIIARGHLRYTVVGDHNRHAQGVALRDEALAMASISYYRVTAGDLIAYVEKGAPDLQMPIIGEGWLRDGSIEQAATTLRLQMSAFIESGIPPAEELQREYASARGDVVKLVSVTQQMANALNAKMGGGGFLQMADGLPHRDTRSFFTAWAIHHFPKAVEQVISGRVLMNRLNLLYASPEAYQAAVSQAWDRFQGMAIGYIRRSVPNDGGSFTSVSFELQVASALNGSVTKGFVSTLAL